MELYLPKKHHKTGKQSPECYIDKVAQPQPSGDLTTASQSVTDHKRKNIKENKKI